jgi:hypothetical protein
MPVTLTSTSSPGAALPDPDAFEQAPLLDELTVQERSVTPLELSITETSTDSLLPRDALVVA